MGFFDHIWKKKINMFDFLHGHVQQGLTCCDCSWGMDRARVVQNKKSIIFVGSTNVFSAILCIKSQIID